MLLSQPDYTHSFKRMPQLLIPLFKKSMVEGSQIDCPSWMDTMTLCHSDSPYTHQCICCKKAWRVISDVISMACIYFCRIERSKYDHFRTSGGLIFLRQHTNSRTRYFLFVIV